MSELVQSLLAELSPNGALSKLVRPAETGIHGGNQMNPSEQSGSTPDREERIRRRAYQIWDESGRPEGRDLDHWRQAEADIASENGDAQASAPMTAATWAPGLNGDPADVPAQPTQESAGAATEVEQDAAGQFAETQHGGENNGVSSAEPRIMSGDESGDATFPLHKGRPSKW